MTLRPESSLRRLSPDESPALREGPVDEVAATDHVPLRDDSPVAAVAGVVAVIPEGEVSARGNGEGLLRRGQVLGRLGVGVAPVAVLAAHDAKKGWEGCLHAVLEENGGVDPEGLTGHAGESLDVELGSECGIEVHLDAAYAGGQEDEDIGECGIAEAVGHPVDKDLVTRLNVAVNDRFPRLIDPARPYAEVPRQDVAR